MQAATVASSYLSHLALASSATFFTCAWRGGAWGRSQAALVPGGAQRKGSVKRMHAMHTQSNRRLVDCAQPTCQRLCTGNPLHLGSEGGVSAGCGKGGAQHGLDAFDAEEIAGAASPGFHRIFLGRCHRRIHDELGDSRGVGGCHADQGRPARYGACRPAGWHADGQSEMAEREQREHLQRCFGRARRAGRADKCIIDLDYKIIIDLDYKKSEPPKRCDALLGSSSNHPEQFGRKASG